MSYSGDVAVSRLYNGGHFYTTDANEAQSLIAQGWADEGTRFYLSSAAGPGLVPLYRLSTALMHFYTASDAERDSSIASGWVLEGTMGYVSPAATADTVPLYRALNPANTDHLYTTDEAELKTAVAGGWTDEGIAGYVGSQKST